ncbi:MAG: S53 family peptidase [Aggregatilineales bacterium]
MTTPQDRVPVPGSEKIPVSGAYPVGPVRANERFQVTIKVRAKPSIQNLAASNALTDQLPGERTYVSREAYAQTYGADPQDIAKVEAFAQSYSLVVVESNPAERKLVLSGTASAFSAAFGVTLQEYEYDNGTYRGRTGPVMIPADLSSIIEGVFGLDNRPQASPHFQHRKHHHIHHAASASFTPIQLAKLYNFPSGVDGTGQCIGIIELGGGYRTADIQAYFTKLGLPVPQVTTVRIDGAQNAPTTPNGADGEVMLDIEVAAAIAPKAQIVVYFAPNTDKGFLDAITQAVHDTTNKPSVISISWGGPESSWTAQSMQQLDQAFQAAATLGVTVCCASGDNGSGDGVTDGKAHVDFPASSPYALACGGTKLVASGTTISSEVVWDEGPNSASGGGVSNNFPLPTYQNSAGVPISANPGDGAGRGVPDVAGDADPATGYDVRVDGQDMVIGGTSAVAPLWAGLIALMNQKLSHPVGFLNPLIYGSLAGQNLFNDITTGSNGAYNAAQGWDACTGWGTPNGSKLLSALGG